HAPPRCRQPAVAEVRGRRSRARRAADSWHRACLYRWEFLPHFEACDMKRPSLLATGLFLLAVATLAPTNRAVNPNSPPVSRSAPTQVAHVAEIPVDKGAPQLDGHPLTSVVVTQCNLIVAVYMTMADGRLLRFDKSAAVPSEQLIHM